MIEARFSGDTDPLPVKIYRRADPNILTFVISGKLPDPQIEEPLEIRRSREEARRPYTNEEIDYLLTPLRRQLLESAGPGGLALLHFMETDDFDTFQAQLDKS